MVIRRSAKGRYYIANVMAKKHKHKKDGRYYIAYGSNTNRTQMWRRCPDAKAIGRIMLDNARLVFRVHADLIYEPGHKAPAVLWRISERDERSLDAAEGIHNGSYSKFHVDYRGKKCVLYLMNGRGVYPPAAHYASVIREGYKEFSWTSRSWTKPSNMRSKTRARPTTPARGASGSGKSSTPAIWCRSPNRWPWRAWSGSARSKRCWHRTVTRCRTARRKTASSRWRNI